MVGSNSFPLFTCGLNHQVLLCMYQNEQFKPRMLSLLHVYSLSALHDL